jgi:hypothetical protein
MRRWLIAVFVLVLLLIAYAAWPLYGLYRLSDVTQRRDAEQLRQLVDFPSVRRSMATQIVEKFLELTGKAQGLGQYGAAVAANVGATLADPELEKIITPEGLFDLLQQGKVTADITVTGAPGASEFRLKQALQVWLDSEYNGMRMTIVVPPGVPRTQQYGLRMRLEDLVWRVKGIELPETMVDQLAREVLKRNPQAEIPRRPF